MCWMMRKKYRVKKTDRRVTKEFKKYPKKDMRPWTKVFFTFALASLIWGSNELLNLTKYDYSIISTTSSTDVGAVSHSVSADQGDDTINILSLELEQIENLANTIAGRNAVWPGYKGDPQDHRAVQRHFQENFAKFINSGIISVQENWKGESVAFAYAVSDKGIIQFVGKIPGGTIDDDYVYVTMMKGISGKMIVTPAQDEQGENIIMLYYIKVKFSILT